MYLPQRKLHRLNGYDYSRNGYYFVTICTKNRRKLLGNAGDGVPGIIPTDIGQSVSDAWQKMIEIDANIRPDYFCLMPNHIHGIIVIQNQTAIVTEEERRGRLSLQDVVRGFKSVTTRIYNKSDQEHEKNDLWQLSFYDEIIRNNDMLYEVRKYIIENTKKCESDEYYL